MSLHTQTNHENCTIKYQLFDLVFKGQGHCNLILICDTLPCPNTHMKAVNHQKKKFCSGQDHVYRQMSDRQP